MKRASPEVPPSRDRALHDPLAPVDHGLDPLARLGHGAGRRPDAFGDRVEGRLEGGDRLVGRRRRLGDAGGAGLRAFEPVRDPGERGVVGRADGQEFLGACAHVGRFARQALAPVRQARDRLRDPLRGPRGLVRQFVHRLGHHGEAAARVAGAGRLDLGVDGEDVDLRGDRGDLRDRRAHALQRRLDRIEPLAHRSHPAREARRLGRGPPDDLERGVGVHDRRLGGGRHVLDRGADRLHRAEKRGLGPAGGIERRDLPLRHAVDLIEMARDVDDLVSETARILGEGVDLAVPGSAGRGRLPESCSCAPPSRPQ
jgi:hypothetical protein